MRYTVEWIPDALATLTDIWIRSGNRNAVTVAQARIDRLLATNPHGNGTPRSEGLYNLDVYPLRVLFEIDDVARHVRIEAVGELA